MNAKQMKKEAREKFRKKFRQTEAIQPVHLIDDDWNAVEQFLDQLIDQTIKQTLEGVRLEEKKVKQPQRPMDVERFYLEEGYNQAVDAQTKKIKEILSEN